MTNKLILAPSRHSAACYFQLWMGNREIACIDVLNRQYEPLYPSCGVRTRARRYAIRWFWIHNKVKGKDESMSPEEALVVLRQMKVSIALFVAAVAEMGWSRKEQN